MNAEELRNIKVGEYIRCSGSIGIRKVKEVLKDLKTLNVKGVKDEKDLIIRIEFIQKHNKNILKLIEKGDLVNGYIITSEYITPDGTILRDSYERNDRLTKLKVNEVKTILTRGQIEAKEYTVRGD